MIDTQAGPYRGYRIGVEGNVVEFGIYGGDLGAGYSELNGNTILNDGTWHYVVGTWDHETGNMFIYVDGKLDGTDTQSAMAVSNQDLYIGVADVTNGYFNGLIDEVKIYDYALTEEQIQANYIAGLNAHQPDVMHFNETTKDETWKCSVTVSDGITDSDTKNSSEITIQNSPPEQPTLIAPTDNNNSVIDRTPEFQWNPTSDPDGDSFTYTLYVDRLSCPYPNYCDGTDPLQFGSLSSENYTPSNNLDLSPYEWKVQACDSESDCSEWSDTWNFTIQPYVDIQLVESTTDFGTLVLGQTKNTSASNPGDTNGPFLIRNNGNCFANVSINATPMFSSVAMNTEYYKYKIDEYTESNTYDTGCTMLVWNNMDSSPKQAICALDFTDTQDEAEIDLLVEVPSAEPSGTKESTITVSAEMD
jgi:hypothetical protein